jgi:hypothetical protein
MAGHGSKLDRKQEEAIAALLTHRNIEEAAGAAGIGARTLLRWLKIPEFQAAYRQARFRQPTARLAGMLSGKLSHGSSRGHRRRLPRC